MTPIGIKLSDEVAGELEALAAASGCTSAQLVSMAIQLILRRQPAELRELFLAMEAKKQARQAQSLLKVKV